MGHHGHQYSKHDEKAETVLHVHGTPNTGRTGIDPFIAVKMKPVGQGFMPRNPPEEKGCLDYCQQKAEQEKSILNIVQVLSHEVKISSQCNLSINNPGILDELLIIIIRTVVC